MRATVNHSVIPPGRDDVEAPVGGAAPVLGGMGVFETGRWLTLSWLRKKDCV